MSAAEGGRNLSRGGLWHSTPVGEQTLAVIRKQASVADKCSGEAQGSVAPRSTASQRYGRGRGKNLTGVHVC